MSSTLRTLLVQHDIDWEDKPANHARVRRLLDETAAGIASTVDTSSSAAPLSGSLVVLPELFDTGFSMDLDRVVDAQTSAWSSETAKSFGISLFAGSAERGADGRGRNAVTLFGPDGSARGTFRKIHPFSHGRESDYYGGGDRLLVASIGGVVVAPMICYDLRFPELWRLAAMAGAEVFVIGANWPAARQSHWRSLCIARAIENQAYVVAVNRVGSDPKIEYVGGSIVVDPHGTIVGEAGDEETVLTVDLDLQVLRDWRNEFPALDDLRAQLLGSLPIDRV